MLSAQPQRHCCQVQSDVNQGKCRYVNMLSLMLPSLIIYRFQTFPLILVFLSYPLILQGVVHCCCPLRDILFQATFPLK